VPEAGSHTGMAGIGGKGMTDADYERMISLKMDGCVFRAHDSLARYKFWMFGYHAAAWVKYNELLPSDKKQPNPFSDLVKLAKSKVSP
jgi:hypothetical protein